MKNAVSAISHRACDPASDGVFKPQITSLVDIMTILLVFLIKSFSAEGQIVSPPPGIALPVSSSTQTPVRAVTLDITKDSISSGGTKIAATASPALSGDLTIVPLQEWLAGRAAPAAGGALPEIMVQADRDVEFEIVKRVMHTCSRAGFERFSVLALRTE